MRHHGYFHEKLIYLAGWLGGVWSLRRTEYKWAAVTEVRAANYRGVTFLADSRLYISTIVSLIKYHSHSTHSDCVPFPNTFGWDANYSNTRELKCFNFLYLLATAVPFLLVKHHLTKILSIWFCKKIIFCRENWRDDCDLEPQHLTVNINKPQRMLAGKMQRRGRAGELSGFQKPWNRFMRSNSN